MYVKCPHCGTSFELDPAVVKDFGGWARCGACMHPFNSEAAALDKLPADDPADVLVRKFDYADDAAHFEKQSQAAKNRNSFIVEPHSRSEIPGFLRDGEGDPSGDAGTEDQAQIPLPLNSAQMESQPISTKSGKTESQKLGEGFESPIVSFAPLQDEEQDLEASLSILVAEPEDIQPPPSLTAGLASEQALEVEEMPDELDWRQQLEADIAAAEKDNLHEFGEEELSGAIGTNVANPESNAESIELEASSEVRELSSEGPFDDLDNEFAIDEELQMSSSIEPTMAAWPEVQVARGAALTDGSSVEKEDGQFVRVAKPAGRGFGNISSSSGAYDRVMSEKADLQNPRAWMVAIIIFSVLAVAQLVNLDKLELSQTVFGRPIVNLWCGMSGCLAGELVQVDKIDLVHTSVSAHDTEAGVLVVDIHMVSRTILGQPHPSIQLTLTDRDGMPTARRVFTAQEYLTNTTRNELAPNVISELTLEIADPPDDSVGFEVALVDQRQ
jgi:predicted Zn finger-like uncharacterized protein